MQVKVGCISLGCPKNLVDSEIMLGNSDNYEEIVNLPEAGLYRHTSFIDAKEEAVDAISKQPVQTDRQAESTDRTGCLAQRYRDEIINEIPGCCWRCGNSEIERVIEPYWWQKDQHLFVNDPADVDYLTIKAPHQERAIPE